jgi:hypothetical protein
MSDEKSAAGEVGDWQREEGVAELRDWPEAQSDIGLPVAVAQGNETGPEPARTVASNASTCSEDPAEIAEEAYLDRLAPEAAMWFQAHREICPDCRRVYAETVEFVDAIRAADKELESGNSTGPN